MGMIRFDFSGQTAIVTGGAKGIGQTASEKFTESGARVFLIGIDEKKGASVAEEIRAKGGEAEFVSCDVTDAVSVERAFAHILSAARRIDILVNNAGGWTEQQLVAETSEEEWDRIIALNLKSVFLCSKAAAPALLRQKSGRIINMGSVSGLTATKNNSSPPYGVAKAGVHQLTRLLAADLGPEGIAVNALSPGTTATARVTAARSDEQRARIGASTVIGRIAEVEDIVGWILFLASPEAGYLMGQTITVNGGRLMV